MPKTQLTVASLHKRLQPIFNRYIRLRDTEWHGMHHGAKCISCGNYTVFERLQAGHFIPERHYATRYDEINVNAQCQQCNGFKKGNVFGYFNGMIGKYGVERTLELLRQWGTKRKYTRDELLQMIETYSLKVKELEG